MKKYFFLLTTVSVCKVSRGDLLTANHIRKYYQSTSGSYKLRTKKEADKIFLDDMTVLGVPRWKRTVMYQAVRLFGRGNYGKRIKIA